jgi:hypothetical protein
LHQAVRAGFGCLGHAVDFLVLPKGQHRVHGSTSLLRKRLLVPCVSPGRQKTLGKKPKARGILGTPPGFWQNSENQDFLACALIASKIEVI